MIGFMTADQQPLLAGLEVLEGAGPEFDGFLANHGPMACEALVWMGIGDQAPRWAAGYRPRLEGTPTPKCSLDPPLLPGLGSAMPSRHRPRSDWYCLIWSQRSAGRQ